jgi:hypothetical protein
MATVNISKWEASLKSSIQKEPTSSASPGVETAPGIVEWDFSFSMITSGDMTDYNATTSLGALSVGMLAGVKSYTGGTGYPYFNGDIRIESIGVPVDLNGKIIVPVKGTGHRMFSMTAS